MVLATEKKVPSSLVEPDTMEKVALLTDNIAVVYSGMGPDFRVLVRKGQKKASEYALVYGVSFICSSQDHLDFDFDVRTVNKSSTFS